MQLDARLRGHDDYHALRRSYLLPGCATLTRPTFRWAKAHPTLIPR